MLLSSAENGVALGLPGLRLPIPILLPASIVVLVALFFAAKAAIAALWALINSVGRFGTAGRRKSEQASSVFVLKLCCYRLGVHYCTARMFDPTKLTHQAR